MTLDDAPTGHRVVLVTPDLAPGPRRRLAELGLRAGEPVRVLHRVSGGGRLVDVAGARIALARSVLRALPVDGRAVADQRAATAPAHRG